MEICYDFQPPFRFHISNSRTKPADTIFRKKKESKIRNKSLQRDPLLVLKAKVGKQFGAAALIFCFLSEFQAERYSVPRLAHCYVCHDASTPVDDLVHCHLKKLARSTPQNKLLQFFP